MAHEVFISYAREDTAAAQAVVERLSAWGVRCWIDRETIAHAHGAEWGREIVAAIAESKALVLLLSHSANASSFVASEAHVAFEKGVPILPFRIEEVPPGDALALYLSRVQWLDAFPVFERHLETLAERITQLIDGPGATRRRGAGGPRVGLMRQLSAHASHLAARGRRLLSQSPQRAARPAGEPAATPLDDTQADPAELAAAGRWWRLKTIVDTLEAQGRPLRRYAPWQAPLAEQLARFDAAFVEVARTLDAVGPARAAAGVQRLREIVVDHPKIETLESRGDERVSGMSELRREIGDLREQGRWLAIENGIRRFLLQHPQQARSLFDAAGHASAHARAEARRLLLAAWTIAAAPLVVAATWFALAMLGLLDGSFLERLPASGPLHSIAPPAVAVLLQIGVSATALSLLATLVRRRAAAGLTTWALVLLAAALAMQAVPWGADTLLPENFADAAWVRAAAELVPAFGFVAALAIVLQLATCRLIDVPWTAPSPSMLLACAAASLPIAAAWAADGAPESWAEPLRWAPHAILFAALLAACGLLTRRLQWWVIAVFATVAGAFVGGVTADAHPLDGGPMLAAATVLFVAGCLASPRHSIPGYLAIVLLALLAALVAQAWMAVDGGVAPQSPVRFAPLLAVWGIACSEVALANQELLSRRMSIRDGAIKLVLLLRSRGTSVQGAWLSRTKWYAEGRRLIADRPPGASPPRAPRG